MDIDILKYKDYLRFEQKRGKKMIFDPIRKKFVFFTPEEMIRQLFIEYLTKELKIPQKYIAVEKQIKLFEKIFRFDIMVFNKKGKPILIVECKSHKIRISDKTALQISKYNQKLQTPYLCLTNGKSTKFFKIDFKKKTIDTMDINSFNNKLLKDEHLKKNQTGQNKA